MVNFNNESTITRAPKNILEILIIEKRSYFLDALEQYYKDKFNNRNPTNSVIRARLITLFLDIKTSITRSRDKEEVEVLKDKVMSKNTDDLLEAFDIISDYLDSKKLLQWDSMKTYDPGSVEEENKFHGLD